MRFLRIATAGAAAALGVLAPVGVVHAGDGVTGPCTAQGTFVGTGVSVDNGTTGTVTVLRSDTVDWSASVDGPPGVYSGSIWLELPWPFPSAEIDSWSGDSQTTSNAGSKTYDLPGFLPAGVQFDVAGEHVDANGTCSGSITLEIEGGPFGSPLTWASLGVSGASLLVFLWLLKPLLGLGL